MAYPRGLAVLANPTRRSLFDRVRKRPQTVGELARQVPVSQPAVSQHLRRLRDAGLVEERREGTRHYFQASQEGLAKLRADLESLWDDVLTAYADAPPAARREREKKTRKKKEPR
jgi:DNA-binding transcriptional ArsR family regulator